MTTSTEADLVASVAAHLRADGWEVYHEVGGSSAPRADIVATHGPVAWVIEAKQSLSLAVIEQAMAWRRSANLVSVATWAAAERKPGQYGSPHRRDFPRKLLDHLGIGLLAVNRPWDGNPGSIHFEDEPRWIRHRGRAPVFGALEPAMLATEPGARTRYWTPFRATVANLVEWVKANPGQPMKRAVESIEHHYGSPQSARACLANMIFKGVIDEIENRDGALYVKSESA